MLITLKHSKKVKNDRCTHKDAGESPTLVLVKRINYTQVPKEEKQRPSPTNLFLFLDSKTHTHTHPHTRSSATRIYLTIIPRARMGCAAIAYEAEGRMDY